MEQCSQGEHSSGLNIRPQKGGFISKVLQRTASGSISLNVWWFIATKLWSLQKLVKCGRKEWPSQQNKIPGYLEYWIKDKVFCRNTAQAQTSTPRLWGCWVSARLVSSATLVGHSQGWTSPLTLPLAFLWTYPPNSDLFHVSSSRGAQWATAMPPQQLPAPGQEEENRDVNSKVCPEICTCSSCSQRFRAHLFFPKACSRPNYLRLLDSTGIQKAWSSFKLSAYVSFGSWGHRIMG